MTRPQTLRWCNKSNAASTIISDKLLPLSLSSKRLGLETNFGGILRQASLLLQQILHNQQKSDRNGTSNCIVYNKRCVKNFLFYFSEFIFFFFFYKDNEKF